MWTKFQTAKWFGGAGNAGSQSGGWSPADPPTYVAVSAVLIVAAFGASYLPSRRATRVDPIDSLRL